MAVTYASDEASTPQMGAGGPPRMGPPSGRNFEEAITKTAAKAVRGVGQITKGRPLDDAEDGAAIFTKSHDTIMRTKAAMVEGASDSDSVMDRWSGDFAMHPAFIAQTGGMMRLKSDAEIRKNFTAQNLGTAGAPYGLVPFDLAAPSRLVYPVYTLN